MSAAERHQRRHRRVRRMIEAQGISQADVLVLGVRPFTYRVRERPVRGEWTGRRWWPNPVLGICIWLTVRKMGY